MLQPSLSESQESSSPCFKPHQRGGGCCSNVMNVKNMLFVIASFKPHQRGGGCCSETLRFLFNVSLEVSNPISGEVGAAAYWFQYLHPRRRHVSNPISGEVGAAAGICTFTRTLMSSRFKPHQRGGGCCSNRSCSLRFARHSSFKPHQRGGGCCSGERHALVHDYVYRFQTPSAGRWVLQPTATSRLSLRLALVSNPISGEVGAAAFVCAFLSATLIPRFKPHQRGGGCCSYSLSFIEDDLRFMFQTPSAGRWVLQRPLCRQPPVPRPPVSNPISGEVGAAAPAGHAGEPPDRDVSNPISGEVGAAAIHGSCPGHRGCWFQTPSAGRWVLQRAAMHFYNTHQVYVSNPISGEVGAAAYELPDCF